MVEKQYKWVWNGTNATPDDEAMLGRIESYLAEHGSHIKFEASNSAGEHQSMLDDMKQNGWRLYTVDGYQHPRLSCWVRGGEADE